MADQAPVVIWLVLPIMGLIAGLVGGVIGFGGSTILLPFLVALFGPKEAVPIMGLAGLLANFARILSWWPEVDWRAATAYSATAIPAVIAGAHTFVALDPNAVDATLGCFMLAMIPLRRWFFARKFVIGLRGLAAAGAGIGFLTGIVASTGPISTPVFLGHGLVKGAYIATEALGSLSIFGAKSIAFQKLGLITSSIALKGLGLGATMMLGALAARSIVRRMQPHDFRLALDLLMLASGIGLIWTALR